jgi:hypothetical protein
MLFKKFVAGNELVVYAVIVILILSFGEPILIWQNVLAFFFLYHYTVPVDETEDDDVIEEDAGVVGQQFAKIK